MPTKGRIAYTRLITNNTNDRMKALRLYIIFIVLFVSHLLASAQSSFRLINTSQGLPDDEVKTLFWTSDGRLGVRTSSSLSFFDGCTFHSVPPMGIREKVRDIFIDSAKDLWFVTASGKMLIVKASEMGEAEKPCRQIKIRTKGLRDVCNFKGNHWFLYSDGWVKGMNAAMTKMISAERVWQGEVPTRDFMQFAQNKHRLWLMWNHGVASYQSSASASHHWQHRYENEAASLVVLSIAEDGTAYASIRQAGLLTIAPNGKTSLLSEIHTLDGETLIDDIQGKSSFGWMTVGHLAGGNLFFGTQDGYYIVNPADVMMPRMNGTDMCRRIKENIETSHIPIILLTAWSTDEGRAAGYKAGPMPILPSHSIWKCSWLVSSTCWKSRKNASETSRTASRSTRRR